MLGFKFNLGPEYVIGWNGLDNLETQLKLNSDFIFYYIYYTFIFKVNTKFIANVKVKISIIN